MVTIPLNWLIMHFLKMLFHLNLCSCLLMQQSAAFKILRTRLKTVPSYSLGTEQMKRASSENPYSHILHVTEDNRSQNTANVFNTIDFPNRLQQFENMQQKHREYFKSHLRSYSSRPSNASQVCFAC